MILSEACEKPIRQIRSCSPMSVRCELCRIFGRRPSETSMKRKRARQPLEDRPCNIDHTWTMNSGPRWKLLTEIWRAYESTSAAWRTRWSISGSSLFKSCAKTP